jgi:hypothetical protein
LEGGRHAQGQVREAGRRGRFQRPPLLIPLPTVLSGPAPPKSPAYTSGFFNARSISRVAVTTRLSLLAGLICAAVALIAMGAGICRAHGGPPLRLGVTADPVVSAVARLALVHLREGVGFAVDWREFPDEAAVRSAFAGGGVDIVVALTEAGQASPASSVAADCPREKLAELGESLRQRWGAEVFLLGLSPGPTACARPALIVSRAVLADLRFGILGKEAALLAAAITREDIAAVRAAAERGGERAATAAARAVLAAKAKR